MMQQTDYIKIFKIAAGAGIAVALAQSLGLNYSTSAGVITLLSIQDTKKETIRLMALRLSSFGLALILSAACFCFFGYGVAAMSVFLLFFSGISLALRLQEGISVNTVLMTHFLAEQSMSAQTVGNEAAILVIGAGIGVLLNSYIPGKEKQIREKQRQIENQMREILGNMAGALSTSEGMTLGDTRNRLKALDEMLRLGEKNAFEEMENKLLTETKYYLRYMNMRQLQAGVLEQITENIGHLAELPPQSEKIARFIEQIRIHFHEYNNAVELLAELGRVMEEMKEEPLPDTRKEFEGRAVLYRILLELEQFLGIKKNFVAGLSAEEIKKFFL